MVSHQLIAESATSKWTWFLRCWRSRTGVIALLREFESARSELLVQRDAQHLLRIELEDARKKLADHLEEHKIAKDGNRALLRFIHTRHRLNVKFDPGTIRESLQRADLKP